MFGLVLAKFGKTNPFFVEIRNKRMFKGGSVGLRGWMTGLQPGAFRGPPSPKSVKFAICEQYTIYIYKGPLSEFRQGPHTTIIHH